MSSSKCDYCGVPTRRVHKIDTWDENGDDAIAYLCDTCNNKRIAIAKKARGKLVRFLDKIATKRNKE